MTEYAMMADRAHNTHRVATGKTAPIAESAHFRGISEVATPPSARLASSVALSSRLRACTRFLFHYTCAVIIRAVARSSLRSGCSQRHIASTSQTRQPKSSLGSISNAYITAGAMSLKAKTCATNTSESSQSSFTLSMMRVGIGLTTLCSSSWSARVDTRRSKGWMGQV